MKYKCLTKEIFSLGEYLIRPLRIEDMESIRLWRNEQMEVLRQDSALTRKDQAVYWSHVIQPSFSQDQPKQILFAYEKDQELIGYGGLTNIDWKIGSAEVSFLMDVEFVKNIALYKFSFGKFISLLKPVAFNELSMHRLFTETFDVRPYHVVVLEENGFKLEKRLKEQIMLGNRRIDSLIHGCIKDEA